MDFFEDGGTPLLAKMFLAAIVAPGICLALIAKKGNPKEFDKLMSSPSQAMFLIVVFQQQLHSQLVSWVVVMLFSNV